MTKFNTIVQEKLIFLNSLVSQPKVKLFFQSICHKDQNKSQVEGWKVFHAIL